MENRLNVYSCTVVFLLVLGCKALPPNTIQKLMHPDPRMARDLELFGEQSIRMVQANISKECTAALSELVDNTQLLPAYIDASGKIPSGIFQGDMLWIGSYTACKNIPSAQYCMANVLAYRVSFFNNASMPIRWGVCVPRACKELDVAVAIKDILAGFQLDRKILISTLPNPRSIYCAKPSDYRGVDIFCLIFCGILAVLCLVGTFLDLVDSPSLFKSLKDESVNIQNGTAGQTALCEENPSQNGSPIHNDRDILVNHSNLSPSVDFTPRKKNIVIRFFKCFSIITNTKRIMETKTAPGAINSVNGMRVLSISWVVLGHVYFYLVITQVGNNLKSTLNIVQRFSFQAIDNAFFSVDSFFFLSGLLVSYIGLRRMEKNNGKIPLIQFYLHRFWRLTPTYMFCILFYTSLFKHLGEGPMWYINQMPNACDTKWWTNFLYLNNFYPGELGKECLGWSWYLANDYQFYCCAPLFLYAMYRFRLKGMVTTIGSFLVASFIATGAIIGYYNLPASQSTFFLPNHQQKANQYTNYVYIKPYCRIAPYLVGIALGYLFFADKAQSFLKRLGPIRSVIFQVIGWSIAFICAFSSLYGQYRTMRAENPIPFSQTENIVYGMLSRFSWSLALAWVVYVCHAGAGGLVDNILSARFWIPLSRLTYGVYLVHPMVLSAFYGSLQNSVAYTDFLMVMYFLGCLMVSYGLSFILAIALEFPTMQMEKLFD